MGRVGLLAAAVMFSATACVSAPAPQPESASGAAGAASGPDDSRCAVFEAKQLRRVLGQVFQGPVNTADSSADIAECQWTADSQTALVLVKASDGNGNFLFRESARSAGRNIGGVVAVDVPGARKAYGIPRLGRVGMLVADDYVEVSTLVPGATDAEVTRLAELAADATRSAR